ncbi:MAG TPA: UbiD family decarboxylase domain-containing protein, partial [Dehalococcoidia bacterium]|nr:UbiD family decarboxylase domain-containing protein [Dehalococcoidia bacterium]
FMAKADARKQPLEIAIVCGADPLSFFTSCVAAPQGIDKFDLSGGFAGRPLDLVKCRTVDLEVPAQAQFVIEGATVPGRWEPEGPFGESTGYYFTFNNPVAKIRAITHRKSPIYHALMPFGPEEPVLMNIAWEVDSLPLLRAVLPRVRRARPMGLMAIAVQIDKESDGDALQVIDALLAQSFIKLVVVVDSDVEIDDVSQVLWALATRVRPDKDVVIRTDVPSTGIDPCTVGEERTPDLAQRFGRASKMGIDATKPLGEDERFEKIDVPAPVKAKVEQMLARVLGG